MAKKSLFTPSKNSSLSQLLIILTIGVITAAVYESVTGNDFTNFSPTQLFLVAGVLGVLGIYLKD